MLQDELIVLLQTVYTRWMVTYVAVKIIFAVCDLGTYFNLIIYFCPIIGYIIIALYSFVSQLYLYEIEVLCAFVV